MRKIDQYFYFEPTVPLHHYTGIGTLLNLAPKLSEEETKLWASHVSYLNDSQEVRHAKEVMRYVLGPANRVFGGDNTYLWFLHMFGSWLEDTMTSSFDMYVFSLSEERSLLSQWRSYTPHGKGLSITFSTELIREIAHINHLRIGKCIYILEEQRELIESLIESLWVTFTNSDHDQNEVTAHAYFDNFAEDILQVLALIKHHAFQEEREWRLISNANAFAPAVKFRQADGALLLVPYTEFKLPIKDNKFDAITLGPTPHRELSLAALQTFTKQAKLTLSVMESDIPFRKW